jgi:hypothetical protein
MPEVVVTTPAFFDNFPAVQGETAEKGGIVKEFSPSLLVNSSSIVMAFIHLPFLQIQ